MQVFQATRSSALSLEDCHTAFGSSSRTKIRAVVAPHSMSLRVLRLCSTSSVPSTTINRSQHCAVYKVDNLLDSRKRAFADHQHDQVHVSSRATSKERGLYEAQATFRLPMRNCHEANATTNIAYATSENRLRA